MLPALVLLLAVGCAGCALHAEPGEFVAGLLSRSSLIRIICPDQLPPYILQDVSCPRACGYSCLPERWHARMEAR